ncbi:Transportin-3 [Phytophthora boehmeriae]|uniref:Transportin-3 n=1 Tax=Phytophthora boehmeriae TaxID=109152 RepID=A0A8T1WRF1_9STRA|nr:Transportin-3 [Phytophthora boehmeriae]
MASSPDVAELQRVVLSALDTLYQPHLTHPEQTQAADAFLRGFQLTPEAFTVCASLLDQFLPRNNVTVTGNTGTVTSGNHQVTLSAAAVPTVFFAAQTLANKLRRQHGAARTDSGLWTPRIVDWLASGVKVPKMVVTQLLLALVAALPTLREEDLKLETLQTLDVAGSQIYAVIRESYSQCSGHSVVGSVLLQLAQSGVTFSVLAELLLLLVEEVDALHDRTARQRLQSEVDGWAPAVLDRLLPQIMHEASANCRADSDSVTTQETVLRALASWLRFIRVKADVVVRNPLLQSLLGFLARDELFDAAVDLAVELVHSYAGESAVVQWLAPRLLSVRGAFGTAADVEDIDTCLGLCRIFTEMGEAYLELLLLQPGNGNDHTALVDLLLDCMNYPDAEVADVTVPFWFKFLQELQHRITPELLAQYKPRLERLAGLCMQKLQFREEFPSLPLDKQQDFKAFRQELGDILRDCCQLLGVEAVLQHCVRGLNLIFQAPAEARSWEAVEAHLYCFRSIARQVENATASVDVLDTPIALIFQHLPQFSDHPAICYTSCLIVSRYAEWLRAHPASLSAQVEFLNTCVTRSAADSRYGEWEVARAAAAAIRALAMDCWAILGADILAFYLHIEKHELMTVEDQVLLLEGICSGVAKSDDLPRVMAVLDQVMKGIGQRLGALFSSNTSGSHVQVALNELLRLMCIYEYLDVNPTLLHGEKHPLVLLTEQMWPLFNQMLALYRGHDELVERVCRCYKRILRMCGAQIAPLLPQLVDNLLAFYQAEPKSSYLYAASMVLKFFSHDNHSKSAETDLLFARMLLALVETTWPIFSSTSEMQTRPDVIEEFFFLMERAVRCVPQVLTAPTPTSSGITTGKGQPLMTSVFACAVAALAISHNDANKAVLCFMEQVYVQSLSDGSTVKLAALCTEVPNDTTGKGSSSKQLVDYLLRGVVLGAMSPSRIEADYGSAAGVLVQLAKLNGPQLQQWVAEWFVQATSGSFATAAVNFLTPDEAQKFQHELFSAVNERAFRRTVRHFGKLCASRNSSFKDCERQ